MGNPGKSVNGNYSHQVFAVVMKGDSMIPEIPRGAELIVDPAVKPKGWKWGWNK